ncbi:7838_t:CDS:2 [Rhizophagus irregularis]|nr:7838_t:CDS:2 [Rhizophagus irregularis]
MPAVAELDGLEIWNSEDTLGTSSVFAVELVILIHVIISYNLQ